jgi:chromosome segregation ATPase
VRSREEREEMEPRFLRGSGGSRPANTVAASELLERLERQAGQLGVLRDRLSATAAALDSERKKRERLEQELANAGNAQERIDEATALVKRERATRHGLEEQLARAEEEIEALRMEVDHAWTRLQNLQEAPARESRWRRRRGQATD